MRKCLVVIHNLSKSGAPQTFLHVINVIKNMGFSVDTLAYSIFENNDLYYLDQYKLACENVYISKIRMNGLLYKFFPLFAFKKTKKTFLKNEYDFILTNDIYFAAFYLRLRNKNKELKSKLMYYSLGNVNVESKHVIVRKKESYIKNLLSSIDAFVGISSFAFLKEKIVPLKNTYLLFDYPNEYYPKIEKNYKRRQIITITQIGYFCSNKNQLFTLDVFNKIKKKYPESKLFFVGYVPHDETRYYDSFLRSIEESPYKNDIKLLSADYDKESLFGLTDVLVLPSLHEGLPLTLLEAQFSKTYCIASTNVAPDIDFGYCDRLALNVDEWVDLICEKRFLNQHKNQKIFGKNEFESKLKVIIEKVINK